MIGEVDMATIKILAGDLPEGNCNYQLGQFQFGFLGSKVISDNELEIVEIATEESVKRIGGTIGWGAVGAVILGPVGLLAGLLLGGKKKEITFVARFKDGKKIFASTDSKTFTKLQAITFNKPTIEEPQMSTTINKKKPIEQLQGDGYKFISHNVVRKSGPWDECTVTMSDDRIELFKNGMLIKVYT